MNVSAQNDRPRTILFLDHTAALGGGEIALLNLVTHLDRNRYFPIVILFSHGPLEEKLRDAGIKTQVLPLAPSIVHTRKEQLNRGALSRVRDLLRLVRFTLRLTTHIRKIRPDIIHTNSLKADVIGGIAGRLAKKRVLWHVRDRIADDYLPPKVVRAFRFGCRTIPHVVIANSQATFDTLQLPVREGNPSRPVHDGIAVGAKPIYQAPADNLAPLIGIVGRLTEWKGQHVFLDAAAAVLREFPNARFQIIGGALFGEEEYEVQLKQQAQLLNLNGHLDWLGFRDDVPLLLEKLDVLVHASTIGEPFGQVVVEGMAAGKPVVATSGGGVPEIIVDGACGILVPMNNATAMGKAILQLLHDPAHAQTIAQAGYERVRDHFCIQLVANNVEAVYDRMIK